MRQLWPFIDNTRAVWYAGLARRKNATRPARLGR